METKRASLGAAVAVVHVVLMLTALTRGLGEDEDKGFAVFFRSNRLEVHDVAIQFNPPLPSWLTGTLVSPRDPLSVSSPPSPPIQSLRPPFQSLRPRPPPLQSLRPCPSPTVLCPPPL